MKSFWSSIRNYLFLAAVLLMTGCITTLGPVYSKVDKIPDNVGLVYLYRLSPLLEKGNSFDVKSGKTVITSLKKGGYFPYYSAPGEKEFWAKIIETKSSVTLDVKAGQIYYIKGELGEGILFPHPHLMVVAPEIAEKEIVNCYLISEP